MTLRMFGAALAALVLIGCNQAETAEKATEATVSTTVLTAETAKSTSEEWGEFVEYFGGETEGLSDLLSGTATIKAGLEIHPPHKHAEEEFLMVLEGEGEWSVGGKTFTASTGDMLYAAAWDVHGIKNTGEEPLKFVFWKAHPKGMPVPTDPAE